MKEDGNSWVCCYSVVATFSLEGRRKLEKAGFVVIVL
jgi:hypothetical protein